MKHVHRLPRMNGRRGAFQLLFGAVYGCLALAALVVTEYPPALAWLGHIAPPSAMAIVWAPPAVAAFIGAFLPRPKDAFSFAMLTSAPIGFGFLYLIGLFTSPAPTSILGILLYWVLGGAVMVVSGMTGDKDRDERKVKTWSPG